MSIEITATVRMFHVGELGDCFWLSFKDGKEESNVLIDCGSFRNGHVSRQRLNQIVTYIMSRLNGKPLDVVIGTHQHNDHLSGFVHCERLFGGMVAQVWLSWLDNPKDEQARTIKREQKNLIHNIKALQQKMKSPSMQIAKGLLTDILGFYNASGSDPEVPTKGIEILRGLGAKEPRYLDQGEVLSLPGLPHNSVKVYTLGPPRNSKLLFDKDPQKDETYDPHLAFANTSALRYLAALDNYDSSKRDRVEDQFPFNEYYKKKRSKANPAMLARYDNSREGWRKIDDDWLEAVSRLGLYLDSYTNNSSLVLAFELVKSGKVLLFAADAQTGNWQSWDTIEWTEMAKGFSVKSLLRNTVLYKVGHHGSHNATLVKALEAMEHPELVAMIPVDKSDSNILKKNGWKMPAKNLYKRLKEKTHYRVLLMDDGFADECHPVKNNDKSRWNELPYLPIIDTENLFVEYKIKG